jgi:hypothetical protein
VVVASLVWCHAGDESTDVTVGGNPSDVRSGDVAEPGQSAEGFVRRKRYARPPAEYASDSVTEDAGFDSTLPPVYLGADTLPASVHLEHEYSDGETVLTSLGARGRRRAAGNKQYHGNTVPATIEDESSLSARAREVGELIEATPSSPPSSGVTQSMVSPHSGSVPVNIPEGMHADAFQERFVAAGESIAGKRKRLLMGTEPSLLNTLLTVKSVADSGAMPVPATPDNLTESNSVFTDAQCAGPWHPLRKYFVFVCVLQAWLRLAALQSLSNTVFTGAHWVSTPYPTNHGDVRVPCELIALCASWYLLLRCGCPVTPCTVEGGQ